jgi:hypothetical protein
MSEKLLDTAPGTDIAAKKPVKSVKKRMKKYFYMVDFSPETEKFYSENKVLSTRRLRLKNGMEKISSMKVEMIKKHLQYLFTIHYVLRTANGQFLFLNDGKFLHLPLMCQMHYQGFSARKIIVSAYPVDPKNFEKAILLLGRECGCAEHSTEPGFLKQGAMTSVCKMSESCIKEMLRRCEEKLKPFARRYEPLNGVWLAAYIEDPAWDGEVINAIANSPRSILCEGTDMIYCEDGKYPPSQASAQTQAQAQAQTEERAQAEKAKQPPIAEIEAQAEVRAQADKAKQQPRAEVQAQVQAETKMQAEQAMQPAPLAEAMQPAPLAEAMQPAPLAEAEQATPVAEERAPSRVEGQAQTYRLVHHQDAEEVATVAKAMELIREGNRMIAEGLRMIASIRR